MNKETQKKKKVQWIYKQHHSGDFWFVDVEWVDKGYFVHFRNRDTALDGDTVEVAISLFRGKEEAKITQIIERSENTFSGVFMAGKTKNKFWKRFWFVKLTTANIQKDIFIPPKFSKDARDKDMVLVKIGKWEWRNPEWKVVQVLGSSTKKWIQLESMIAESGFNAEISEKLQKNLDSLDSHIDSSERKRRKDLTELLTFTIDGEDAKDLDDAISIELSNNERWDFHKLYVHIADVAHFVKEWTELDTQAIKKWTSVYLADRVIPMLPQKLSNDLCSLNTSSEKLSLTCEMHIDNTGWVFYSEVYESIIKSNYRFTYKEIDEIEDKKLDKNSDLFWGWNLTSTIIETLGYAQFLKNALLESKRKKWILEFDFPETRVLIEDYEVQKIYEYPKYRSNILIEQFMVLANEQVALLHKKIPFLYRIHDIPKEESLSRLQALLEKFEIEYTFFSNTPWAFRELLWIVEKHPKKAVLEKMVLRSLQKAEYKEKNVGHFWLASKNYSHFTSPIRRYPDLQNHRIIKEKLSWKLNDHRKAHYKETLPKVALSSSQQEQKAEKLEYRVRDYYITKYYSEKVWEQFSVKVSGLIPAGVFVELPDSAEWFVEMNKTIHEYREEEYGFFNKMTEESLSLWDSLQVQLIEADMKLMRLNFEIV